MRGLPDAVWRNENIGEDYVVYGCQTWLKEAIEKARQAGDLTIEREDGAGFSIPGRPNFMSMNFTRTFVKDPTDPSEFRAAGAEGKRQAVQSARFFKKYIPGFENAELKELALQIGVRESRQIKGLYRLTKEDVLELRQFDDVIAQCCYAIDIHDPDTDATHIHEIPNASHYDIPLRCLVPKSGPRNLIVAGRCISATHEAMASFRVQPSVMAIGEAAGVTAALSVEKHCAVEEVDYHHVQKILLSRNGILE